jgi:hypothetical protein
MAKIRKRRELHESIDMERYVDPTEAYLDPITNQPWLPAGGIAASQDELIEPFRNEQEHRLLRQRARILWQRNPYAKNLLRNVVSFTVGQGHKYTWVPVKQVIHNKQAVELAQYAQKWLDLLKINRWNRRQKENQRRYHRDGELFTQVFPNNDGYTRWRAVEPGCVRQPKNGPEDATYGILPDEDDVETIVSYFIDDEEINASYVQHRKANVDMNVKRGLTSLYVIDEHLVRADKLLRNMSKLVTNQASITLIRRHNKPTSKVQSFASSQATVSATDPYSGETLRYKKLREGGIYDVRGKDIEYEFPSLGVNVAAPIDCLAAELRAIAASMSLPEYMVGSDASNANYASTMVAESPAVRAFEDEQSLIIEDDLELIYDAVDYAIQCGKLPPEIMTWLALEVSPPTLVTRNRFEQAQEDEILDRIGIKSKQTMSQERSLDYSQEQSNRELHRQEYGELDQANMPVPAGFGAE